MLWKLANHRDPSSLAARLRRRRMEHCRAIVSSIPKPLKVLNVGGGEQECVSLGLAGQPGVFVTVLNRTGFEASHPNIVSVIGDARDMREFADEEFDFVFSNSVIEHVGDDEDVRRMANEVRRVAKRYYVQTPNRYFPIEPHFLFPCFQFLPIRVRAALLQRYRLGWMERQPDPVAAEQEVRSINLLSKKQMGALFPEATVTYERTFGLAKSILSLKAVP